MSENLNKPRNHIEELFQTAPKQVRQIERNRQDHEDLKVGRKLASIAIHSLGPDQGYYSEITSDGEQIYIRRPSFKEKVRGVRAVAGVKEYDRLGLKEEKTLEVGLLGGIELGVKKRGGRNHYYRHPSDGRFGENVGHNLLSIVDRLQNGAMKLSQKTITSELDRIKGKK